jgi:3-oxoacyl-[acyl-carrier-protein] synthase-3
MYAGVFDKDRPAAGGIWLDFLMVVMAEQEGALLVRQDTCILPNIVRLGVEEWLRLVRRELVKFDEIEHVLCHYSSEFFRVEIMKALAKTKFSSGEDKFFSNLHEKGNTGAASIWIMLDEAMRSGLIKEGDCTVLMVPEDERGARRL